MNHDVVVIGGGPAGCGAAYAIARRGVDVLLLEKGTGLHAKVCGGCIGAAGVRELEHTGMIDVTHLRSSAIWERLSLFDGARVGTWRAGPGMSVARSEFDGALRASAALAGAEVILGASARIGPALNDRRAVMWADSHGRAHEVLAGVVVLAAGLGAARSLGIGERVRHRSRVGLSATLVEASAPIERDAITMLLGDNGYMGLVRMADGRVHAGAAVTPQAMRKAGGAGAWCAATAERNGFAEGSGFACAPWRGTPALTRTCRRVSTTRLLVVGDAAGYSEPFTGEGIGWALRGGRLAGDLIAGALVSWDSGSERAWERMWRREIGRRRLVSRAVSSMVGGGARRRLTCGAARRASFAIERFIGFSGLRPPREVV